MACDVVWYVMVGYGMKQAVWQIRVGEYGAYDEILSDGCPCACARAVVGDA